MSYPKDYRATLAQQDRRTAELFPTLPGLRPYCTVCGWRKGGVDSWDGRACKCKLTAPPLERVPDGGDQ